MRLARDHAEHARQFVTVTTKNEVGGETKLEEELYGCSSCSRPHGSFMFTKETAVYHRRSNESCLRVYIATCVSHTSVNEGPASVARNTFKPIPGVSATSVAVHDVKAVLIATWGPAQPEFSVQTDYGPLVKPQIL